MIKRQIHIFLTAVMFYTRIPCPSWVDHDPAYISLSTTYLPFIGWIVGIVYAGSIVALTSIFSPLVSIILGLVISIFLTGAFHEDGFADMCDGFGGGWTREKILLIMKDSRVGTYGVVGLLLLFAIKVTAIYELVVSVDKFTYVLMIITSHTLSRAMPVIVIRSLSYVQGDSDQAKAKPVAIGISSGNLIIAMVIAFIPLLGLLFDSSPFLGLSVIPMLILTLYLMRYFKKWIGGYTGDCLGSVQQLSEVVFLLSMLVIWKFI